jgi:UrcA family protein
MSLLNPVRTPSQWLVTLAAIACTVGARPALAAVPIETTEQVTVKFADLDLSTPEGAQALYGRIKRAARMVCDDLDDTEPELIALERECYDQAVANAVAKANRPTLTSLYQSTATKKG